MSSLQANRGPAAERSNGGPRAHLRPVVEEQVSSFLTVLACHPMCFFVATLCSTCGCPYSPTEIDGNWQWHALALPTETDMAGFVPWTRLVSSGRGDRHPLDQIIAATRRQQGSKATTRACLARMIVTGVWHYSLPRDRDGRAGAER